MKRLAVIISGAPSGDNLREITVERGSTARDVLNALGLTGYLLSREGSGQHYAEGEEIYSSIDDGNKLRATPIAEVGVSKAA